MPPRDPMGLKQTRSSDTESSAVLRYRPRRKSKLANSTSSVILPRLVQRDLPFHQSSNRLAVKNKNEVYEIWSLITRDWFHVLLRMNMFLSVLLLLTIWTLLILLFAAIYVRIDVANKNLDCGLGPPGLPIAWGTAFAFSLETCTTVGYGLPGSTNAFFESQCPSVQIAIYAQMTWSMMFNAFLFAFFFAVLAKCENRAIQLVFANKLCITTSPIDGKVKVVARCYDVDSSYPVVETHVRMYVLDHRLKMHVLRLQEPNDDLGGMLYTSLPVEVVHHVDHHSALSSRSSKSPLVASSNGLVLRSCDSATNNRTEVVCPVCGETFGTHEQLKNHVNYYKMVEERDGYPIEGSHLGFEMPEFSPITLQDVKYHMEKTFSEIIVVVEGIDPQVSGTFQALQSYKYRDIVWDGDFEPCLSVWKGKFTVDLEKFHQVRVPQSPPPSDSSSVDLMEEMEMKRPSRVTIAEGTEDAEQAMKRSTSQEEDEISFPDDP